MAPQAGSIPAWCAPLAQALLAPPFLRKPSLVLRVPADGHRRRTDARLDVLNYLHGRPIEDRNLTTVRAHENALQAIRSEPDEARQQTDEGPVGHYLCGKVV